jgi:hypothetical protein
MQLYCIVVRRASITAPEKIFEGWQELVQIRNKVAHGDLNFFTNWNEVINHMLSSTLSIFRGE